MCSNTGLELQNRGVLFAIPNDALIPRMTEHRPLVKLREQLAFLRTSSAGFDSGLRSEAIRIAAALRVLLWDKGRNKSLLTHNGLKDSIKLATTVLPVDLDPDTTVYDGFANIAGAQSENSVSASLGGTLCFEEVPVSEWWNQIVYVPRKDVRLSRGDLIREVADTDGGAHVDEKLKPSYEALVSAWSMLRPGMPRVPLPETHWYGLRRMAHEVLNSPELLCAVEQASLSDVRFWQRHADRLRGEGDIFTSLLFYHRALDIDRSMAAVHKSAGILLVLCGEYEHALSHLDAAGLKLGRDGEVKHAIADCWLGLGDSQRAEAILVELIAEQPNYALARYSMATLYYSSGKLARALPESAAAARLAPGDPLCRYLYGSCLRDSGQLDQAVAEFVAARAMAPDEYPPRLGLAHTLDLLGRRREAVAELINTVRRTPQAASVIAQHPVFEPHRCDPQLAALLAAAAPVTSYYVADGQGRH